MKNTGGNRLLPSGHYWHNLFSCSLSVHFLSPLTHFISSFSAFFLSNFHIFFHLLPGVQKTKNAAIDLLINKALLEKGWEQWFAEWFSPLKQLTWSFINFGGMRNSAWLLDVIWSKHGIATKDVSVNNKFSQNTINVMTISQNTVTWLGQGDPQISSMPQEREKGKKGKG